MRWEREREMFTGSCVWEWVEKSTYYVIYGTYWLLLSESNYKWININNYNYSINDPIPTVVKELKLKHVFSFVPLHSDFVIYISISNEVINLFD